MKHFLGLCAHYGIAEGTWACLASTASIDMRRRLLQLLLHLMLLLLQAIVALSSHYVNEISLRQLWTRSSLTTSHHGRTRAHMLCGHGIFLRDLRREIRIGGLTKTWLEYMRTWCRRWWWRQCIQWILHTTTMTAVYGHSGQRYLSGAWHLPGAGNAQRTRRIASSSRRIIGIGNSAIIIIGTRMMCLVERIENNVRWSCIIILATHKQTIWSGTLEGHIGYTGVTIGRQMLQRKTVLILF